MRDLELKSQITAILNAFPDFEDDPDNLIYFHRGEELTYLQFTNYISFKGAIFKFYHRETKATIMCGRDYIREIDDINLAILRAKEHLECN
jgi:hypothetical protein